MTQEIAATEVSAFQEDAVEILDRLDQSGGVEVLTVGGKPMGVIMAPHVYDAMADKIEEIEITAALRRGFADIDAGRVRPAEQAILDLATKLGLDLKLVNGE